MHNVRPGKGPDGKPCDLESRRVEIMRRYLEGQTQYKIGRDLQLDQSTVARDLRTIRETWVDRQMESFSLHKAEALARIDNLEREAWEAWHRSQAEFNSSMREQISGDKNQTRHMQRRARAVGQAAYLAAIQWCIDRRIKLLGLDAPHKIDITKRIRAFATAQGLDPDEAVAEAQLVLKEFNPYAQPLEDEA
jgi:hypothetical protein